MATDSNNTEPLISDGFLLHQEWLKTSRNVDCCVHIWTPKKRSRKAAIVFHGLGSHGLFCTTRPLCELLAQQDYHVYSMDMPGHGKSIADSTSISINSIGTVEQTLQDAAMVVRYAYQEQTSEEKDSMQLYLAGVSMGGAIALHLSILFPRIAGLILVAPMISLNVPSWQVWILKQMVTWNPNGNIPGSGGSGKLSTWKRMLDQTIRNPVEKENAYHEYISQYHHDKKSPASSTRTVRNALTCIQLSNSIDWDHIKAPYLVLMALDDVVVNNDGVVDDLWKRSASVNKTFRAYEALHGMMCECEPLLSQIKDDVITWLQKERDEKESHMMMEGD